MAALLLGLLSLAGLGYYGIPVAIIGAGVFAGFVAARAKRAGGPDKGTPQDTPGGPQHEETGFAHEGQAAMTPDQQQRTGA